MAKLKIDLDELDRADKTFQDLYEEFRAAYEQLDRAIENLRNSGWISGASSAYFLQYEETWKKNMKKHIDILVHLGSCLHFAKNEYGVLLDKLPNIAKQLS